MTKLYCVYHPIDGCNTVTEEERQERLKTGTWFDSPADAEKYRDQIEQDLINEQKAREDRLLEKDREQHQLENPAQKEEPKLDAANEKPAEEDKPKRKRANKKQKEADHANDDFLVEQEHDDKPDFADLADLTDKDNEHENLK